MHSFAMRLRNLSSSPNIVAGRRMVAPGKASRTASSPSALLRDHADGASTVAPNAETWTRRSTPTSAHTCASTPGKVWCTSVKDQRIVSKCLPTRLMTTLLSATAASMSLSERIDDWTG